MEKIQKIVLFFFFFASVIINDCPLNLYPTKTVLGYINAQVNNDPNLHNIFNNYQYALSQQLIQTNLKVAIGIVGFQFNPNNIIDFVISYVPSHSFTSLDFKVKLVNKFYGWKSLTFNFIASQSQIFQMGSVATNEFSVGLDKKKYLIYRPLPKLPSKQFQLNGIQIKIFLNGLQLNPRILGEQFNKMNRQYESFRQFSSNQRLIQYFSQALQIQKSYSLKLSSIKVISKLYSFTIQSNSELNFLSFSYLIFNKRVVQQMHNFISNNFQFTNSNQFKFSSLQNMEMLLTGLVGFKLPRQSFYYFRLNINNLGGESYYNFVSNIKYFDFHFSYVAFDMKLAFSCRQCYNSPLIYQNKMCIQQCPRSYSLTESNGIKFCQHCDIDKLKIVDQQTGKCICAKRHYFQILQNSCKPCTYDCMTCDRPNRCLTCDNNYLQTKRKLSPDGRCKCPLNRYYDDKNSEDIVCQACHTSCLSCNGPRAHNCLTCEIQKQRDSLGFCVCKNGFTQDSIGNCVCLPPNTLVQNNLCIDLTSKCEQNKIEQYVSLTRRCVCKPGYVTVLNECIKCQQLAIFNKQTLKCQCPKPTVQRNGQCKNCESNKIFDEISGTCVCRDGTFESKDGVCVECPPKMVLLNDSCQCIFNYYEDEGTCKRCRRETDGPKCRRNIY